MIWQPSNIYKTAKLGKDVNVGAFTEIGNNVCVGDRTRIGAFSFIPEGVTIGCDVFIGPHVCFTNDRYPPSPRDAWEPTIVEDHAAIGAGCVILPGLRIGRYATIGAGSVVTKDVPPYEIWAGNPARLLRVKHSYKNTKAHTLVEMLVTIGIICALSVMMIPASVRVYKHCKAWIWGCYAFHENRMEAVDNDVLFMRYCTSKPAPWSFVSQSNGVTQCKTPK